MIQDFILQTCNNPGTSATCTLIAPPTGRLAFRAKFATGLACFYFLDDSTQAEFGYATLTWGSPDTLSRDTVLGNTAGTTARLNFTGTTRVYNALPGAAYVYKDKFGITNTGPLSVVEPATGIGTITLTGTGTNGANIKMVGNGAVTPNKYLRVLGGAFHIINSAYSAVPLVLSDAGALTISGALTTTGVISSGSLSGTTLTLSGALSSNSMTSGNINVAAITATSVLVTAASVGKIQMVQGDATHTGYLSFSNAASVQQGYIGYAPASGYMSMTTGGTAVGWATNTALSVGTSLAVGSSASIGGSLTVGTNITATGAVQCGQGSFINFSNATGLAFNQTGGSAASAMTINLANTSSYFNYFTYAASGIGSITTNGTSTFFNTTSDSRLKIDDGRLEFPDDIIDGLIPRWHRWKSSPDAAKRPGFFAQEVQKVYPWAVTEGVGAPGDSDYEPWQIDNSTLMPVVIAELQALRSRVTELETRI